MNWHFYDLNQVLIITRSLCFLVVLGIVSCSEKSNKTKVQISFEFSYDLEMVNIYAGEHLFNLAHGIPKTKLSPDEKFLYFFDDFNLALEKINLENKEFVLSIPLEKEGPKGIGATFDYVPNEDGTIQFLTQKSLFSIEESGKLLSTSPTLSSIFKVENEKQFFQDAKISKDHQILFSLPFSGKESQSLGWINLKDSIFHEVFLDSMAYRKALEINLGRLTLSGMLETEYFGNKIFIYHDDGIDFYVLDPTSKSWNFYDFEPTTIPKRKEGNYPKTGSTSDATKILELEGLEINYNPLVYDSANKRYYRIASIKRENQIRGTIPDQFLLIFSEDLKLIHEENLSQLPFSVVTYFVRKGKFWVQNRDAEELEFFVFDFKLN